MSGPVFYHEGGFPPGELDLVKMIPLIGKAHAAVARFDGMLSAIPNANVLLSPMTTQEAVLSSRIEGTQATMGEVLEYEARGDSDDPGSGKEADIWEVLNYRKAMRAAVEMLREMPLCQRLVRNVHEILLNSVRGNGKSPGEYRRIPNWIGPPGCAMEEARFVPIGADKLAEGMSRWEKFIHAENDGQTDRLIQLALIHAEFEALHPFLDGNGRLGRMLIPLFMYESRLITGPMFYISAFFEANRDAYYERLLAISRDDDWTGWCAFFLEAVRAQAEENLAKTRAILDLYERMKIHIIELTHSQHAIPALDWIFERPVFKSSDMVATSTVPRPTAHRIINLLKSEGILEVVEEGRGSRPALLAYTKLLEITEGRNPF